jgi:hypothetical protein
MNKKEIQNYPIHIDRWEHLNPTDTPPDFEDKGPEYCLIISHEDPVKPEMYFFKVGVEYKLGNFFEAETTSTFQIHVPEKTVITPDFLFPLLNKSAFDFSFLLQERIRNTNLAHLKIRKIMLEEVREYLQICIDTWNSQYRHLNRN